MLDYIWLDDKSPIVNQLPDNFKSVAILLHPFVEMPLKWKEANKDYPSCEESLCHGKPVSWQEIMSSSGLKSYKELALALKTSICAFKEEYERMDLANKLNSNLKPNLYYPTEDSTSVFMLNSILEVLASKGANKFYFSDPIWDNSGLLNIKDTTPLDISDLASSELILTDENMDFVFMSLYDSFTTIFLSKDENIEDIVQAMNWEAVICNKNTFINWYFR